MAHIPRSPLMVEAGNGGRIINITSVHEHIPRTGASAYCTSKGGLGLLTKVMAMELAQHGMAATARALIQPRLLG